MKLFRSKSYKAAIGFIYGWGATAVIVGALFKIM
ncbi:GldL-related protein, partial [Culturomica massiliensis]